VFSEQDDNTALITKAEFFFAPAEGKLKNLQKSQKKYLCTSESPRAEEVDIEGFKDEHL